MTVPTTSPDGSRVPSGMPETATLRTPADRAPARRTFRSQLAQAFAMFHNPKSIAGLIILGAFVLIAVLAPGSPRTARRRRTAPRSGSRRPGSTGSAPRTWARTS